MLGFYLGNELVYLNAVSVQLNKMNHGMQRLHLQTVDVSVIGTSVPAGLVAQKSLNGESLHRQILESV